MSSKWNSLPQRSKRLCVCESKKYIYNRVCYLCGIIKGEWLQRVAERKKKRIRERGKKAKYTLIHTGYILLYIELNFSPVMILWLDSNSNNNNRQFVSAAIKRKTCWIKDVEFQLIPPHTHTNTRQNLTKGKKNCQKHFDVSSRVCVRIRVVKVKRHII